MPLLSKRPVGDGFLAIWRREESTEQLLSGLTLSAAERDYYDRIAGQSRRRKEWLTWHRMVRQLLGPEVETDYDAQGSPTLVNHAGQISISHAEEFVVLYWQPTRCGVDIENCDRNFDRVSARYISAAERQLPGADRENRFPALMWCVKETAYKFAGQPGLDFLRDIRVTRFDPVDCEVEVRLPDGREIRLQYEFLYGHCLAYTFRLS